MSKNYFMDLSYYPGSGNYFKIELSVLGEIRFLIKEDRAKNADTLISEHCMELDDIDALIEMLKLTKEYLK